MKNFKYEDLSSWNTRFFVAFKKLKDCSDISKSNKNTKRHNMKIKCSPSFCQKTTPAPLNSTHKEIDLTIYIDLPSSAKRSGCIQD